MPRLASFSFLILLLASSSTFAVQDEDSAKEPSNVLAASRSVYEREIKPLQTRIRAIDQEFHKKNHVEATILGRLKTSKSNEDTLERVQKEIEDLSGQLEMLVKLESILSDMDPEAVAEAIEATKTSQERLLAERNQATKPLQSSMSEVQRDYREKNDELAEFVGQIVKPKGEGDFDGYLRKFGNGNFAYSMYSCSYSAPGKTSALSISIHFVPQISLGNRERELLDGKYPIYQWSNNSLIVFVNGTQISLYDSGKLLSKERLPEALKEFVDLKEIAELSKGKQRN